MVKQTPSFSGGLTAEQKAQNALNMKLKEIGPSEAVSRWLSKYGSVRTRAAYAVEFVFYLRWLKAKGVKMTPDDLVKDNLVCVFKSDPTDVSTKRKHTDLLNEFVNVYLVRREAAESTRVLAAAAIRSFYQRNDSELFGDYRTASQKLEPPAKALYPEDIRKVLLALPLRDRAPLLLMWQSGMEPERVFTGSFPTDQEPPVRVDIYGRKMHRRPYFTFIGSESVEHLRLLGERGFSKYQTVFFHLKATARRLGEKGLLKNPELPSWRPYALRHSFETEASHAGVKAEVRDYFMGHVTGIQWVYNHRDEIHPEDLATEYRKIEPYVSLNPDGATLRSEFEKREASLTALYEDALESFERLKAELQAAGVWSPAPRSEG